MHLRNVSTYKRGQYGWQMLYMQVWGGKGAIGAHLFEKPQTGPRN